MDRAKACLKDLATGFRDTSVAYVEPAMSKNNNNAQPALDTSLDPKPLDLIRASSWGYKPPPEPQKFVVPGFIPAQTVTSLGGDGGLGKTLIAETIAIHIAAGRELWCMSLMQGPVIGVFCEDDQDEIERRGRAICEAEGIPFEALDDFHMVSRDNEDSLFCTFDRDGVTKTRFYRQLEREIAMIRPVLVILDTAADFFAGDYMSPFQVRYFLRNCLGSLCNKYGCAVLLLSHPSATGVRTGSGAGYSVQWNNAVRSRLYLSRPDSDDLNRRLLEVKKSNRGRTDISVRLVFGNGYFVKDTSAAGTADSKKKPQADLSPLAVAAVQFIAKGEGKLIPQDEIVEHLKGLRLMAKDGVLDSQRRNLQRTLAPVVKSGKIFQVNSPRGYGVVPEDAAVPA